MILGTAGGGDWGTALLLTIALFAATVTLMAGSLAVHVAGAVKKQPFRARVILANAVVSLALSAFLFWLSARYMAWFSIVVRLGIACFMVVAVCCTAVALVRQFRGIPGTPTAIGSD